MKSEIMENKTVKEFTLPYPPSLNRAYRAVSGRVILSAIARDYIDVIAVSTYAQGARSVNPIMGRIAVCMQIFPPDRRRRDIANCEKLLCDSLTKARVWDDDSQIDRLTLIRMPNVKDGKIIVQVQQL
jgi:crossover junction endodeoxyribonuclease RusA